MLEYKIRRILTEELLREAASLDKIVKTLVKSNPDDRKASEIGELIMADPTAVSNDRGEFVGRYWKWIYNQYKQGNVHEGDIPELRAALNTYNINKSQINKPIDGYKTLDELVREIADYDDDFKAGRTISKGEQELEKVYEDQYVVVYIPHTWRAARKIGGDTRWCTASSSNYRFNYYLNNYGGEYYDIIRKSDGAKFQIHPESNQFKDSDDEDANFASVFDNNMEARGLYSFFEGIGKDVGKWKPRIFFGEVGEKLAGRTCLSDIFDEVSETDYGVVDVELNGKYNFVDEDWRLISNRWFDDTMGFENGFAAIAVGDDWNYIDATGRLLSPNLWFDDAYGFNGGVASVNIGGKWNFIDTDGDLISKMWFDAACKFESGFSVVSIREDGKEKYNFLDMSGSLLSPNLWFDDARSFNDDGYASVKVGRKRHIINRLGGLYPKLS